MFLAITAKISDCRTVDQIIDLVYFDYRATAREFLLKYAGHCDKRETVKTSEERFRTTLSSSNVPNRLRVKAPEFQLTKEFSESGVEGVTALRNAFTQATQTFQSALTTAASAGKKAELAYWDDMCDVGKAFERFTTDVTRATWESKRVTFMIPTIETVDGNKTRLGDWVINPQKRCELAVLNRACPVMFFQISKIVEIRHRALSMKIEKKREVAAKADIEMADATKPGPSIQSLVDKQLNARLKKLNLVPGAKKVRSNPSRPTRANDWSHYSDWVWPEFVQGSSAYPLDFEVQEHQTHYSAHQGDEEGVRQEERQRKSTHQERSKGKGKGQSLAGTRPLKSPSVRPAQPSTLPDEILTTTWDSAVTFVHTHMPLTFINAGQYRSSVHCSDGVVIPPEIANDLSLGLKYMLFVPPSKKLILSAWNDFQRRLRWRIFFSFKDGINKPFDPDYSVNSKKNSRPPVLPQFMELGLVMGRRYVNKTIASIPDETLKEMQKQSFSPKRDKILKYLSDNNYVITMTDKNLGLAVSERDWLKRNELTLLQDKRNYKELSFVDAQKIMKTKQKEMLDLANMADEHMFLNELNVGKFLRSKIPEDGNTFEYPQFHGIPKIHKKPTGFRPIIPCHSVIFNPAAKFISKELKPLVKAAPSIIHGTKDLFIRLSQLRIDSRRKFYFVWGDVVAYYPNIPLRSCIQIISRMYEEWLLNDSEPDGDYPDINPNSLSNNRKKLDIFKRAIETGNSQLITQHVDKYFLQLNGLAMGVADSPDLANLYGYHFEKSSGILTHPDVAFYGRYIDDCFALVYADSEQAALNIVKERVVFDECVIDWAVSESGCQFLDAFLFKEHGKLEWKPYVKNGNHRERIPWVSHHPLDVKRGVYIGECSRLAVICSNKEIYIGAIRDLNALYIQRGYPENLVMAWCKKNIQERWEKRFTLRTQDEHDEGVLVLKSRFDDVWNWFSAAELGKTVTEYWDEWYTRAEQGRYLSNASCPFPADSIEDDHQITDVKPDLYAVVRGSDGEEAFVPDLRKIGLLGRRWIVSRKRNANLFDLANVWKKTVFRKLDEAIAEEGGVVPMNQTADALDNLLPADRAAVEDVDQEEDEIILHQRERSEDLEHPEFGRISKSYNR